MISEALMGGMVRHTEERDRILIQEQLLLPEKYIPLKSRSSCLICTKSFGAFRRRCNCHICGMVVCKSCTLDYIADIAAKVIDVRVCTQCDHKLDEEHKQKTSDRAIASTVLASKHSTPRHSNNAMLVTHQPNMASAPSIPISSSTPYYYALDFNWGHAWPKPPFLAQDMDRIRALAKLDIPHIEHENMTATAQFACEVFDAPIAAVSFIDEHQQWFAASQGLAQEFIPRIASICAHTIALGTPMVVLDLRSDVRFQNNPLVRGPGIAFYAGAPIVTPEGHAIGTVFVMDTRPRSSCDLGNLTVFADVIMSKLLQDIANQNQLIERMDSLSSITSSDVDLHPAARPVSHSDILDTSQWVPTSQRNSCHVCRNRFSLFFRKKHCRLCGDIVCKNCVTLAPLATVDKKSRHSVVVCLVCIHTKKPAKGSTAIQSSPALTTDVIDDEEDDHHVPLLERNQSYDVDNCAVAFTSEALQQNSRASIVPLEVKDYSKTQVQSMLLHLLNQSNKIQSQLESQAQAMSVA